MKELQKTIYQQIDNLVIAIIGDKGGIGKTLISYNLIYRIYQDEPSCQLIDCDNDQYSSADFAELRKLGGIKPELAVVAIPTKNLEAYLLESSKKIKVNVIEFGKSFGETEQDRKKALDLAIRVADIILYPMPASPIDALATGKFEEKMPIEIEKIPALLIPNRVQNKARLKTILNSAADLKHFKITDSYLSDRVCYQDSFFDNGKSIFEIKPKNKSEQMAIDEFERLYQEIIQTLLEFYK